MKNNLELSKNKNVHNKNKKTVTEWIHINEMIIVEHNTFINTTDYKYKIYSYVAIY